VVEQVALSQNVMKSVMKDGEHFGKIPGCGDKPTLLKPGAEKLCFTFRMDPQFDIDIVDLGKGHREYRIKCTLYAINGGNRLGSGVGSAATMESKWRFRTGPKELTETPVPKDYWDNRHSDPKKAHEAIGGKGHTVAKGEDGKWYIATAGEKVEHDNPADVYNTVLKMAKKRAMVDAVLTCTAASDIFTQDIEELVDSGVIQPPKEASPAPVPSPSGAGTGEGQQQPLLSPAEDEVGLQDCLYQLCKQIASIDLGGEEKWPAALATLTENSAGKYGKMKVTDVPLSMDKKAGGTWSPLKVAISKAEEHLKKIEETDIGDMDL